MYLDFYKFNTKPFELTPDPHFVYLGEKHKEALALLKYGILGNKGFILLTGEVGTGKTTMVHTLLRYLNGSTRIVHLSNSVLNREDFLYYIASSLGIKPSNGGKGEFLIQFEKLLKEYATTRTNILLIIDEAQALSFDLLEEIRLLSNMGTSNEKLLNIILVGQPELNTLLSAPQCRPLLQRISIRYHLLPLNPAETAAYIQKRVIASGGSPKLFHKSVVAAVYEYSNGYPRLINSICDNTLLMGFVQDKKKLTPEMIRKTYMEMNLPLPAKAPTQNESGEKPQQEKRRKGKRLLKIALLALLMLAFMQALLFTQETHSCLKTALTYCQNLFAGPDIVTMSKDSRDGISPATLSHSMQPASSMPTKQNLVQDTGPPLPGNNATKQPKVSSPPDKKRHLQQTIRVKEGDTLMGLALKVYGIVNEKILLLLATSASGIENPNIIEIEQDILFPSLTDKEITGRYSVHVASFSTVYAAGLAYNRFKKIGTKVHVLLSHDNENTIFRVALGTLKTVQDARKYADHLLSKKVVDFANPINLPNRNVKLNIGT